MTSQQRPARARAHGPSAQPALADGRTAGQRPGARPGELRGGRAGASRNVAVTNLQAYVRDCLLRAAEQDLPRGGYAYRSAAEIRQAIEQSLEAAFRSNTVRINVSTPTAALDLDSSLEIFDAVQVIGSDSRDRPVLLHQAGRVPAAIEGDASDEDRVLDAITGLARVPGGVGAPAQQAARQARQGDFLAELRIFRTSDLILFQRTVPRLAGLNCNPCRIVGIVERSRFDQRVRKIDGVQATIFLIGMLTLIGLIPLLQLKLRKHLDATGRASQYFMWFSLTLLGASASVSVLAIWSSAASRNCRRARAHEVIGEMVGSVPHRARRVAAAGQPDRNRARPKHGGLSGAEHAAAARPPDRGGSVRSRSAPGARRPCAG